MRGWFGADMKVGTKNVAIGVLGSLCLCLLGIVAWELSVHRATPEGSVVSAVAPSSSRRCVSCHRDRTPGLVGQWETSTHAEQGVGCVECHTSPVAAADSFEHFGEVIATIVTPLDCAACHVTEAEQFARSHHAAGGDILASLDNVLAETVEGARMPFAPHSPTPGRPDITSVNGLAAAFTGCQQCHGSRVALRSASGGVVTVEDLRPGPDGLPTDLDAVASIAHETDGRPVLDPGTWPNTGIGRLNLDGSRGSCSACHSRHDFSPRRARQPENCGKCHLGPDHPQKEIYEASKHGVAYRDLRDQMNLDAADWVLGRDYSAAPTCATCHMSGHRGNGGAVTHDPRERLSWTNRPPVSLVMDTDATDAIVTASEPDERQALIVDTAEAKRGRMTAACGQCHTPSYIDAFYQQYDDFVVLYNEKFAKPGRDIMATLANVGLLTPTSFDDEIEWTWFYLWHHEGRRARHGASMMAPDYAQWHGMYEVAERFYLQLIPQARALSEGASPTARTAIDGVLDAILSRPEHAWYRDGAAVNSARVRAETQRLADASEDVVTP